MSDPTYPLYPFFGFLGVLLPLIPLPWHLKAWNSGTCFYMIWVSVACLNQFVNAVVWKDNVTNWAPIWCDISIRITIGASVALPASSLCINRRLFHIATSQNVVITRAEKRRAILIDSLICVLFPFVYIALQYIVQGHRFNIFEGVGCFPALYNTLPMYFISAMWPIVIGLGSATYGCLTIRAFCLRRLEFNKFLTTNRAMSVSRYFRLMALAMTEISFTIPLAIFSIWLNSTATTVGPWRSWADTHYDYGRVERFPALIWRQNHLLVASFEFTRWINVLCAFVFFAFFGFADEAKRNYRLAFWTVAQMFGYKPAPKKSPVVQIESVGRFRQPKPSTIDTISSLSSYSPPTPTTTDMSDKKEPDSLSRHSMHHLDDLKPYDDAPTKRPDIPVLSEATTFDATLDDTDDDLEIWTTASRGSGSIMLTPMPPNDAHITLQGSDNYSSPLVR